MTLEHRDALHSPRSGLCGRCRNARITNAKNGSRFYLCRLSGVNPLFPRYPRIPVLRCAGYEALANAAAAMQEDGKGA